MRKTLKMLFSSTLLVAALLSFSAFTSASPAGATGHATPAGFTGHVVSNTILSPAVSCPPTISEWSTQTSVVIRLQNDLSADYGIYFDNYPYNFHPPLKVDGSFGPNTFNAVRDFQWSFYLTEDGIVGPKTWHALGAC
jgi:hypothetical protein